MDAAILDLKGRAFVVVLRRIYLWLVAHPQVLVWPIILLAYALRIYRLAEKNVWWDEGSSIAQAPMSLVEIALYQAGDQHPPLYYWLLHLWYGATGSSLLALRLLSVLSGVLGIAVAYALGKRLFHRPVPALLGAFLLAISGFHIEWSQEIKMYSLTSTLAMLSALVAITLLQKEGIWDTSRAPGQGGMVKTRTWPLWLGYVLVGALSVYCHYISLLSLMGQNLFVLAVLLWRRRSGRPWSRFLLYWVLAQVAILALSVPWFLLHAQRSTDWEPSPAMPVLEMVRMVATLLSVGTSLNVEQYTTRVVVLWALLLLAFITRWNRSHDRQGALFSWILLLVPWALTYLLTLPIHGIGYETKLAARFFILCQTPFCLLLALALYALKRLGNGLPLLGLAVVVGLQAGPLQTYYAGRYLRDDYGSLARTIQAYGRQGEAIVLFNDQEYPLFDYAYRGKLPIYHVPSGLRPGKELVSPYIKPVWKKYDGIWLVVLPGAQVQDPQQKVSAWLADHGKIVLDERYGERRLLLYRGTPRDLLVTGEDGYRPTVEVQRVVAPGAVLWGYDQALSEVRTGNSLCIGSVWQLAGAQSDLRTEVGLANAQGAAIGPKSEAALLGGELGQGALARVRNDLPISTEVPSGRYRIRLYLQTGIGEKVAEVDLGSVRVIRTIGEGPYKAQYDARFRLGEMIQLQGYDLKNAAYRPGQNVELTLYWSTQQKIGQEYVAFVHLLGQQTNPRTRNPLWGQVDGFPMQGKYPTSAWQMGEVVADHYAVPIDPKTPPGSYALEIGLYSPDTLQRLPVFDDRGQALGDRIILAQQVVVR